LYPKTEKSIVCQVSVILAKHTITSRDAKVRFAGSAVAIFGA